MHTFLLVFGFSVANSALAAVSWTATPFNPPSVPLAVRSPYLSAWLSQGEGAALNDVWPTFWTGTVSSNLCTRGVFPNERQIVGWAGYIRVDNIVYNFLGAPSVPNTSAQKAVQQSLKVSPCNYFCVTTPYLQPHSSVYFDTEYFCDESRSGRLDCHISEPSGGKALFLLLLGR